MGSLDPSFADDGSAATLNIIDIRTDTASIELKQEITKGLSPDDGGEKTLPTLLLYDSHGLKLFEEITYLDEYYLTGQEIALLRQHAKQIAASISNHFMLIELGSGNLRKTKILLDACEDAQKQTDYYALDLDLSELQRTLAAVPSGTYNHVRCFGLHGTYDDGLVWLNKPENKKLPKTVLSLGSSIGNFSRPDAAAFVKQFATVLAPNDGLLVALDACQNPAKVFAAYNDQTGVTHDFTLNGLKHANKLLGSEVFELKDWEAQGMYDSVAGKHQAFVSPKTAVDILNVPIARGERIRIEESYKYSPTQAGELWKQAGVTETAYWCNRAGDYGIHLLQRSGAMFSYTPERYAAHPVPSFEEYQELWKVWDTVTTEMIRHEELSTKPIKLRNACIFYLGHIPTFLDMKLAQGTNGKPTEPGYYYQIFERGIDPDVDNPEQCHAHSEIPDEWPPVDEILQYQKRVRARVANMYTSGQAYEDRRAGRVLWLGFEHEVMHLETLLYMLLQSDKTLPPPSVERPNFKALARDASQNTQENRWFDIPDQTINLGLHDPETKDGPLRHFGWDVEKPVRVVNVKSFKAKGRPITNGEYAQYLNDSGTHQLPASWATTRDFDGVDEATNGDAGIRHFYHNKAVRTIFGPVALKDALDWPVFASYDELAGCAIYMGGRIPTVEEARSIYEYANAIRAKEALESLGKTIPAVNSHLINEGVQESPPSKTSAQPPHHATALDATKIFVDLSEANVGFKNWHPVPVTPHGDKLAGQGGMGGLWEWTSSELQKQDGFEPMEFYPAYSADFYDGKHNIVLGGSWATHPRVAGRMSFVNWYQRNYPYAWAGARLVKDI